MFKKLSKSIAFDGIRDLYNSKGNPRHLFFWSLCISLMIGTSAWFTYRTVVEFVNSPTVTKVDTVNDVLMDMPEMIISYNGGINVSALREANFSETFIQKITSSFFVGNFQPFNNPTLSEELTSHLTKHKIGLGDFAKNIGYTCEDLVLIFQSNNTERRCRNSELIFSERGNSYAFKNNSPQWYPGLLGGMQLVLKAPETSYVRMYPKNYTVLLMDMNDDFSITLEKTLGQYLSRRSYLIPTKTKVEITLNTKFYKRLSCNRPCSNSPDFYTSNTCFFNCWVSVIKMNLNCVPLSMSGYITVNQSEICNPFSDIKGFVSKQDIQNCNDNCVPLCNEWIYEATLAYSSIESLTKNQSVSIVSIGYNTMQYTKVNL